MSLQVLTLVLAFTSGGTFGPQQVGGGRTRPNCRPPALRWEPEVVAVGDGPL